MQTETERLGACLTKDTLNQPDGLIRRVGSRQPDVVQPLTFEPVQGYLYSRDEQLVAEGQSVPSFARRQQLSRNAYTPNEQRSYSDRTPQSFQLNEIEGRGACNPQRPFPATSPATLPTRFAGDTRLVPVASIASGSQGQKKALCVSRDQSFVDRQY
jgi:hypothetical protein